MTAATNDVPSNVERNKSVLNVLENGEHRHLLEQILEQNISNQNKNELVGP